MGGHLLTRVRVPERAYRQIRRGGASSPVHLVTMLASSAPWWSQFYMHATWRSSAVNDGSCDWHVVASGGYP
jgi:hypothetical protein